LFNAPELFIVTKAGGHEDLRRVLLRSLLLVFYEEIRGEKQLSQIVCHRATEAQREKTFLALSR